MNFKDVFRSIQETGGASYNMTTGVLNPETGYMVPLKGHSCAYVIPHNLADFSIVVKAYLMDHLEYLLNTDPTPFLGFWIHEMWLIVDLAENIQDFEEAYQKGFDRDQIAIHDCNKKRDITIIYSYPY